MESVSKSNGERSNLLALISNHRMGIDIYAQWDGMTTQEEAAQVTGFSIEHGHVGARIYLTLKLPSWLLPQHRFWLRKGRTVTNMGSNIALRQTVSD